LTIDFVVSTAVTNEQSQISNQSAIRNPHFAIQMDGVLVIDKLICDCDC